MNQAGSSHPHPDAVRDPAGSPDKLRYRCVCGTLNACSEGASGVCSECRRPFTVDPLQMSMTVTVDTASHARSASDEPDDLTGARLDHFVLEAPLGRGGMGAVYRALDESLERYVAIKVIRSSHGDPEQVRRLMQEAVAQARVNHPHIAHVYFVKRDPQTPYLAMELAAGGTLSDRLKEHGTLRFWDVSRLAEQLADALRHAAEFDIVHGDIKPSNILVSSDGRAKLADFGLARRRSQLADAEGGSVSGTPYYLAPEAADGAPLDERADMYALGVTLFELTFGGLPYTFQGNTLPEAMETHRTAVIEFPPETPEIPEGWRELLARLMAKRPEDRYSDYDELIDDLRRVRPADRADAGHVLRMQSWLIDAFVILMVGAALPLASLATPLTRPIAWLLSVPAAFAAAPLMTMLGTTVGKWLLQLRTVDEHGLRPRYRIVVYRHVLAFALPLSMLLASPLGPYLGPVAIAAAAIFSLVDAGFLLFGASRRSLHDRLLGTRVVLASERD